MPKFGMVIDLQKCVGCGSCAIACKTENNTQDRTNGQTFNWADFIYKTEGEFPGVQFAALPVLCNHCTDAACVEACPVTPKAMHKTKNGITMHNEERCIGCRLCQEACPYSAKDVNKEKAAYSVISFNDPDLPTHPFYRDSREGIKGGTASGVQVAQKAGDMPPYHNRFQSSECADVRRKGITEKCLFCEHRVMKREMPYCVVSCPSQARVFGDLEDKNSEISKLLKKYKASRLGNNKGELLKAGEAGTKPNVYYIRNFKAAAKSA
jgi:Fe-S-cluster-containing dehydrogenase component